MRAPIGSRIRQERAGRGLSQAALARAVGISASYMNLIESSRREVGGAVLLRIAEHLQIGIDELSGEREQKQLKLLQELVADPVLEGLDFGQSDLRELVVRFPEIAQALVRLYRTAQQLAAEIEAYADRFNTDPVLGGMLHEVLNRLTGMRSSAEIVARVATLKEPDRQRFVAAINDQAQAMSVTMRNLVDYFDRALVRRRAISPLREVEDAFIAASNHFPELEAVADRLRAELDDRLAKPDLEAWLLARHGITCRRSSRSGHGPAPGAGEDARLERAEGIFWLKASLPAATRRFRLCRLIAELNAAGEIEAELALLGTETRAGAQIAFGALASYVAGAMLMPYEAYLRDAEAHRYDIDLLSHRFGASFEQAAHRLVTLRRKGAEGVPFGFLRADASGRLTKRFPLPGLALPGGGHGCLLWPIYASPLSERVIRRTVAFPNGARFLMLAKSVPKRVSTWEDQPLRFSVMLICSVHHAARTVYAAGLDLRDAGNDVPVGPSCRLCSRAECGHRQEAASPI
ncbi:XRE family transcriptional regulator [Paracoccus sp. S-4012]|uniref:helix-turn-helix domain-containing protein n=1 Tax=Paracoccus sp. S-4012 TaxID=2665648 RepID=UPI0018A21898